MNSCLPTAWPLHAAASSGNIEEVHRLSPEHTRADNTIALFNACLHGHVECVAALLPNADHGQPLDFPLREAVLRNHVACVNMLRRHCSDAGHADAIVNASLHNRVECLQLLLGTNPSTEHQKEHNTALLWAAAQNFTEVAKLLLPHCTLITDGLILAARNGHTEMVQTLLPHSNTYENNSMALQHAYAKNNQKMIDVLTPVSDESAALKGLQENRPHEPHLWTALEQRVQAIQQKCILTQEVHRLCRAPQARAKI